MNIEAIYAHSGRRKDQKFASDIEKRLGVDVISADRIEDVVRKADILVTGTNSTKPIIHGEYVGEGIHINAVGADCPQKIELDHGKTTNFDKLIAKLDNICDKVKVSGTKLIIKSKEIIKRVAQITDAIAVEGFIIKEMSMRENTLEDVFIHLTGRALRN